MFGYIRVAAAVPVTRVGDVSSNTAQILEKINIAAKKGADLILFPELSVCGYTCKDLFLQPALISSSAKALSSIAKETAAEKFTLVVGLPLYIDGCLYNCAATVFAGKVRGITVKTAIPAYGEFFESRWFSSADSLRKDTVSAFEIGLDCSEDYMIPVGNDIVYNTKDNIKFAVEIGEDKDLPISPATLCSMGGAEVILNLSANGAYVAKKQQLKDKIAAASERNMGAYVYCSAGAGESTTDSVFSGWSVAAQGGKVIAENERFIDSEGLILADIDTDLIRNERIKEKLFYECAAQYKGLKAIRTVAVSSKAASDGSLITYSKRPFVPEDHGDALLHCEQVFDIQSAALKRRLETVNARPVIGVSGGLDSTLALLVCVEACRRMGKDASEVHAITMPCFGTTGRTKSNATKLMEALGVTSLEISIKDACVQHCKDIGHPIDQYDVTFENIQARERTQVLMDYSCRVGGLVIGTGDLSELALGWCTYNADHMSMYGVNCSVPKTLLKFMIEMMAQKDEYSAVKDILLDIIDTPISPELLPPDSDGTIGQETESLVGPYILHDFFLYHAIKHSFEPKKIYHLAKSAFDGDFDEETVKKWLKTFYRRFFTQQFKRSCQPDGVKVGSVAMSPRADWKMPSDAYAGLWLEDVDKL